MPDTTTTPTPTPAPGPKGFDNDKFLEWLKTQPAAVLLKAPDCSDLTPQDQNRHAIYIGLVMALVSLRFNGNKNGAFGDYDIHRKDQVTREVFDARNKLTGKIYGSGEPYYGHNIAAIAVDDAKPQVIDFDFNHNALFSSSLEHAEARLIRRISSLAGLTSTSPVRNLTVYTTLEPCAQCAGVMALAGVKAVVYAQRDEGTRLTANILYNLQPYSAQVKPIEAGVCGVGYSSRLHEAYMAFQEKIMNKKRPFGMAPFQPPFVAQAGVQPFGAPFFKDENGKPDWTTSISAFLCTDAAKRIFDEAAADFNGLSATGVNQAHVVQAQEFLKNFAVLGHRGTPH